METIPTLVRIPPQLREYLEREAKINHRSLSAEILIRLEISIAQEKRRPPARETER